MSRTNEPVPENLIHLIDLVIKILRKLGFNRAISYGVLTRVWGLISGPITILMIGTRLTKVEQGFYYTISSLLALQLFFELGLMTVIAQFASHEFAHLTWGDKGEIDGDPQAKERFIDLLSKGAKWFSLASVALILVLAPVGLVFLGKEADVAVDFGWRLPWVLAVVGTALNLFTVPFFAVVMGSGDVATVNHREMMGAVVSSVLCWTVLAIHGRLYAASAVTTGGFVISWIYLLREKPAMLKMAWHRITGRSGPQKPEARIYWWREVWPLQWKLALTWVAGYFVFQLFTPVLFRYQGAVVAGQMGMTLSAANALLGVSLTWINARTPEFGKLVAKREWGQLDSLLRKVLLQSSAVSCAGATVGALLIWLLQLHYPIGQRFIPAPHAALFFAGIVFNVIVAALGGYLRAHKQEPFLPLSITLGFVQGGATWLLGMKYSTLGVTAGFCAVNLVITLPVAFVIWNNFRKKWHTD